jgi:hypothetical protein
MKNAGTAMKQIHAGLTIDKVDNVMYASCLPRHPHNHMLTSYAGRTSANNTQSARRSAKPSPQASPPTASTKTNSTRSSRNYNKRSSTSRCSTQATYPFTTPRRARSYHKRRIPTSRRRSGSTRTTKRRSCGAAGRDGHVRVDCCYNTDTHVASGGDFRRTAIQQRRNLGLLPYMMCGHLGFELEAPALPTRAAELGYTLQYQTPYLSSSTSY